MSTLPPGSVHGPVDTTATGMSPALEIDDIQSGALHERPSPYVGTYLLLKVHEPADGRELIRRLIPLLQPGRELTEPGLGAWLTVAFTYEGLKVLGVPQDSLDSFAPEFQQGMAARAAEIGDVGANSPEHWEKPLGTSDVHIALGIFDRADNATVLGATGFHNLDWTVPAVEIGYWVIPEVQGQGYVTEAVSLLTDFAFAEFNANRISIHCDPLNERSKRVAERLGYQLEGRLRNKARTPDGGLRDTLVYSLVPGDPRIQR